MQSNGAQGSMEYLLIVGAAIIVVAILVFVMGGFAVIGTESIENANIRNPFDVLIDALNQGKTGETTAAFSLGAEEQFCIDSDGENYFILGAVTFSNTNCQFDGKNNCIELDTFFDKCIGNNLVEMVCQNNFLLEKQIPCENGCNNGACN